MNNTSPKKFNDIRPTDLTSLFGGQVRSDRVDQFPLGVELSCLIGDDQAKIVNISESGLALKTSRKFEREEMSRIHILSKGQSVHEDTVKIAWVREEGGEYIVGAAFLGQHLGERLISWLLQIADVTGEGQLLTTTMDADFALLVYEMRQYLEFHKNSLDKLEASASIHSVGSQQSLRKAVDVVLADQFVSTLKDYSKRLDQYFSKPLEARKRDESVRFFRRELAHFYTNSNFVGRANAKPLGYAGDYEMMNQIYRDQYEGGSLFQYLMHKYGVNEYSSESVKFRKQYLMRKISEIASGKTKAVIGSLACGPAREIVDLLATGDINMVNKLEIVLMDQDREALLNAKRNVTQVLMRRDLQCKVHFLPVSVRNILEGSKEAQSVGTFSFDFIYTAGLYDYLTQPVAKALTATIYQWVKKDGLLVVGNFHPNNPTKTISELVADWKLVHRNEAEMIDLIDGQPCQSKGLRLDELEIDGFLEVIK